MSMLLVYAIPVFLGSFAAEAFVWRHYYKVRDTLTNLACGLGSQLMAVAFAPSRL